MYISAGATIPVLKQLTNLKLILLFDTLNSLENKEKKRYSIQYRLK